MNLYKVGEADAVFNHTVPNAWLDVVRPKKDYMDGAGGGDSLHYDKHHETADE